MKYDNDNYVEVADTIAEKQHKGQFRKDNSTPYVEHPREVAKILKANGVNDDIIISAALLHDVIEDCPCDSTKLFLLFTKERVSPDKASAIVELVLQMTNPDKSMSVSPMFNRKTRKAIMNRHFKYVSPEAAMIKIADRYCNIYDLEKSEEDEEFISTYAQETLKLIESLRTRISGINEHIKDNFIDLCDKIDSRCTKIINELASKPIKH